MSDDNVQTYGTHARYVPAWHFFVLPVFLANAIVGIVAAVKAPSLATEWAALVGIGLALAVLYTRRMTLRVQDRVVRLEETLRLERLLPGRSADIERLTLAQLIGLRFASDAEVPHLVDRILAGELSTAVDVKRAVQHWRPDHLRA